MNPLKITFKVSGGFAPPPLPLHLDALLAYQRTRQEDKRLLRPEHEASISALRAIGERLPLEKHEQDGEWCWKASAIVPVGPVEVASRFYTQRRDQAEYSVRVAHGHVQHGRHRIIENDGKQQCAPMEKRAYPIDTLRGVYRNLLGFYGTLKSSAPTSEFLELVAWCVGDQREIEARLRSGVITHLGARRRSGHGRIEFILVEEDPTALENWKLRVRPWKMMEDDAAIQAAWKAPYWAIENRGQAFCPVGLN